MARNEPIEVGMAVQHRLNNKRGRVVEVSYWTDDDQDGSTTVLVAWDNGTLGEHDLENVTRF